MDKEGPIETIARALYEHQAPSYYRSTYTWELLLESQKAIWRKYAETAYLTMQEMKADGDQQTVNSRAEDQEGEG